MAWKIADDRKLADLYRRGPSKGGLASKNIKPEDIHDAINRFFPEYTNRYSSFAPLYRRKARAWNLEKALGGKRRGEEKQENTEEEEEDEDDEDDEDFVDNGEEDISLSGYVDPSVEEEDDRKMPARKTPPRKPAPAARKTTPKKTPAPPPPVDDDDDDLNARMGGMDLNGDPGSRYDFSSHWSYMLFTHLVADKREHCAIHMWVPTLPSSSFKVNVHPGDRRRCHITTYVHPKFYNESRLDKTMRDIDEFNDSTHENTSYKKLTEAVKKEYYDDRNRTLVVTGDPEVIDLPFACESELEFNVVYHRCREMDEIFPEAPQYMAIMHIDLTSTTKPKEDTAGGYKVVDSDDEEAEEQGADEEMG